MDITEIRAQHEAHTRQSAVGQPKSMPGWGVSRGTAEVSRMVDEDVVFDAITLLRSVDMRRYWMPECAEIRAARKSALDALNTLAQTILDRSWGLYRSEVEW